MSTTALAHPPVPHPGPTHRIPPWWMGYLFLLPMRKLWEHPRSVLAPWISEGDSVFELGPAMGYFTLDVARMTGPAGRVICTEIQPRMREILESRLRKANLQTRVETRPGKPNDPCIDDLTGVLDFALLHHVIHEVTDPGRVIGRVTAALRPGGRMYLAEPEGHVSRQLFQREVAMALETGLRVIARPRVWRQMVVVLEKGSVDWDFKPPSRVPAPPNPDRWHCRSAPG
jgi:SAM-dependent methyltransferase